MLIRPYQHGEEDALRALFFDSVHGLAHAAYTPEQRAVWAPAHYDSVDWAQRIRENKPYVAIIEGQLAGFADLQPSGYIDHFFVSPHFARQGVGTALMCRLMRCAEEAGIYSLYSNVSLTAERLFLKHGFRVEQRNDVNVRGIILQNTTMRLALSDRIVEKK